MSFTRKYENTDESERQAVLDLVEWFGFKKSLLIFREIRKCTLMKHLDGVDMAISFGGVSGRPVTALFRRFFGAEAVEKWKSKSQWKDDTPIIDSDAK